MYQWQPYRALYIHIPFCKQRCLYCDFKTTACVDDAVLDAYTDELCYEIRDASRKGLLGSIETVYFGGGTPSYLGNRRLSRLLYTLSLSMHLTPEVECTLEANPDSLTSAMVKDLYALGVTRISLGVQSFDNELLETLGRIHNSQQAKDAIGMAQERFDNISIDLMCGLPGQSAASFTRDLREALSLGVKHISVYPLMVEEGTPLNKMVSSGVISIDEDFGAECMDIAAEVLGAAGMMRYEVASYAFPGYESRHNQAYWTGVPYLGLGNGAVGMRQSIECRQRFDRDGVIEELDVLQYTAEDLMLGMRRSAGITDAMLSDAASILEEAPEVFTGLQRDGYVAHCDGAWRPTHKGWLYGNQMYGCILELAP